MCVQRGVTVVNMNICVMVGKSLKESSCLLIDYEPQTICEHLQYLFALLQNSKRRYIDPSGFVKALGLDTGQQQVTFGCVRVSACFALLFLRKQLHINPLALCNAKLQFPELR